MYSSPRFKKFVLFALLLLLTIPYATAHAANDLAVIRIATARYHDQQVAFDEGFQPVFECIDHASEGAMGYHYGLFSRFDAELVLDEPEVLVYAPDGQGKQKLAAIEYIIPAAAWTASQPPTFLGKTLQLKNTVGPHEVDPYWELHVWVWRNNPTDMFADWNPQVSCAHEHEASGSNASIVKTALATRRVIIPISPIIWPKPPTM